MKDAKRIFWAERFLAYRGALKGYFRRRVRERDDAEDLAQEVYLRILRTEEAENNVIRNPEAYLYTVALNLLRERAVLARRRQHDIHIDDVESELTSGGLPAEEKLERDGRRKRLMDVVDDLPPNLRAVLIMQYKFEMSYEQMAQRLGVSTHAIKKYVGQALALCRKKLRNGT